MNRKRLYGGVYLVTLSTLAFEILLTRIFSVTLWYHFAFFSISLAMFGLTVGAVVVFRRADVFTTARAAQHMYISALLFAATIVVSLLAHLLAPVPAGAVGIHLAITFPIAAIPFVFSGTFVCLALTKFPEETARVYAWDLVGAANGCIVVFLLLEWLSGPSAVLAVAVLPTLAAMLVTKTRRNYLIAMGVGLVLGAVAVANAALDRDRKAFVRVVRSKGAVEDPALYEKWNSFSRIRISGDVASPSEPFGWSLNRSLALDAPRIPQLMLEIDEGAGTILTRFDGADLAPLHFLRHDITNMAHHVRQNADVLVVGSGGGRDILSALVFRQEHVTAVEVNPAVVSAVNEHFGDFTGHLDRNPRVEFVIDDARTFASMTDRTFDIIHISLIDTFAATAAGAFTLTENSLYTVEGWDQFLGSLTEGGIFSVSWWWTPKLPKAIYRLVALADASLRYRGISSPREHVILVRYMHRQPSSGVKGVGTLLVSNQPFSPAEVSKVAEVAAASRLRSRVNAG